MINLQVGVKTFLRNSEGKFLLVHRNLSKYGKTAGSWDIVGGRINPGTKLIDNLKREIKEETNLEIISEPKLIYAQDIIPSEERHIVRLTYVADCIGEIQEKEDLDEYVKEILDKNLLA